MCLDQHFQSEYDLINVVWSFKYHLLDTDILLLTSKCSCGFGVGCLTVLSGFRVTEVLSVPLTGIILQLLH